MPLGMSAHALAQALRVPITRINDYVSEKRAGTADIVLGLARYFQTTLEFWRNVQPLTCAAPRRNFWEFIDEERNTIVKQYQMRAGQGVTVRLGGIEINLQTGEEKIDPPVPPIYHYTINSGPYAGRDQRELLLEAIEWWENQLGVIDDATAKL